MKSTIYLPRIYSGASLVQVTLVTISSGVIWRTFSKGGIAIYLEELLCKKSLEVLWYEKAMASFAPPSCQLVPCGTDRQRKQLKQQLRQPAKRNTIFKPEQQQFSNNAFNVRSGNNAFNVRSGNNAFNVRSGNNAFNVRSGNNAFNVRSGNNTFNVRSGNTAFNFRPGNNAFNVRSGNNTFNVRSGNNTFNFRPEQYGDDESNRAEGA